MDNVQANSKANSFYVIVSGLFTYNQKNIQKEALLNQYSPWKNRINNGDYEGTYQYLKNSYYDGYLNNIFPEIRHGDAVYEKWQRDTQQHFTLNEEHLSPLKACSIELKEQIVPLHIDFIDLYLLPQQIGIFSMKISLADAAHHTVGVISDTINRIRYFSTVLQFNGFQKTVKQVIDEHILQHMNISTAWENFNPQLKTYAIIDLEETFPEKELNELLFDMGNVSPIGSAAGNMLFSPSQEYYEEQMQNNRISIFKNWSALTLYDTFTRISMNFPDKFRTWEYDFFNVYIYSLYMKSFLYFTSTKLSDVTNASSENEKIRDQFVEFVNDYHHTQISYKFLPDLLKDKIAEALDIPAELDRMEVKIKRINQHIQEKRQQNMNFILMAITFLGLFTLAKDIAYITVESGGSEKLMYPWGTVGLTGIILLLVAIAFWMKKK